MLTVLIAILSSIIDGFNPLLLYVFTITYDLAILDWIVSKR